MSIRQYLLRVNLEILLTFQYSLSLSRVGGLSCLVVPKGTSFGGGQYFIPVLCNVPLTKHAAATQSRADPPIYVVHLNVSKSLLYKQAGLVSDLSFHVFFNVLLEILEV